MFLEYSQIFLGIDVAIFKCSSLIGLSFEPFIVLTTFAVQKWISLIVLPLVFSQRFLILVHSLLILRFLLFEWHAK